MFNFKSPTMMLGMISGILTDDVLQQMLTGIIEFTKEKQAAAGADITYKLVIEFPPDMKDMFIRVWEHNTTTHTNTLVKDIKATEWKADDLKKLIQHAKKDA